MAPCSVCSVEASKYKCAACKALSCSLPCFKTHAAQCKVEPPDREAKPTASTTGPSENPLDEQPHPPSSVELSELFQRYPTLSEQLQDIYKATQRPGERAEESKSFRAGFKGRGRGRGSHSFNGMSGARHWTRDKGFDRGLKLLQRALEQDTGEGEALRAFAETILKTTKNESPGQDADTWVG